MSHEQIMRMTWRQFDCYRESFSWLLNEQSDKGKAENERNDIRWLIDDPRMKGMKQREVDKANAALAKMREKRKARALQ